MSLRSYKKSSPNFAQYTPEHVYIEQQKRSVTIWELISGALYELRQIVNTSTIAGLIVPSLFIGGGLFLMWQQIGPAVDQQLKEAAGYYDQGTTPLVAGEYVTARTQYVSNPGAEYFRQLTERALAENVLVKDPVSNQYVGTFYLSVPSLGMDRIPVKANVESGVEEVYNSVLNDQLAHFKDTGLPISDVKNNIVIYGHSAMPYYSPSPSDPLTAFSFLSELKIGDEMLIEIEGETHRFVMSKSKIVEPDDVEIITGNPGKRTLTLFTCYPRGSNSHRYVAVGREV